MVYLHSRYKSRKFATGGAVILGNGEDAVMRPPPGEPPPIDVPDDIPEDAAPADQVAATIERARSFRNDVPAVKQSPVSERRFSAPVSRESVSYSGKREDRPGRITLSIDQREAAKIAGISEVQYAEQLIRLREEKAQGNYIGNGQ